MMLNDSIKGIPGGVEPFPLREISKQGWNVLREDLPLPLMVLKQDALRHNSELMQHYLQRCNLFLAPHGKTHMAPQLFDLQIAAGAWAITAATVSQIQIYRRFGVQRILMANQLFGRQNVLYIVEEINRDPKFEFYCLMDSADGVRYLAKMLRQCKLSRPIKVLLEAGFHGGRTGFLDWGVINVTTPLRDASYFVNMAMQVEDRRTHEEDLLRHYLDARRALGGEPIGWDEAWQAHRLHALYCVVAACSIVTFPTDAPERRRIFADAFLARVEAAIEDLESLDALGAAREA